MYAHQPNRAKQWNDIDTFAARRFLFVNFFFVKREKDVCSIQFHSPKKHRCRQCLHSSTSDAHRLLQMIFVCVCVCLRIMFQIDRMLCLSAPHLVDMYSGY